MYSVCERRTVQCFPDGFKKKAVLAVWGRVGKAGDHLTPIYMKII